MTSLRIGLAFDRLEDYVLRPGQPVDAYAELDDEETVGAIERALVAAGHRVQRLGGFLDLTDRTRSALSGIDIVFNLAEGVGGVAREAQVPSLLEARATPYTGSDPLTLALCLDKGLTKRIWRQRGLPTAAFTVVGKLAELTTVQGSLPPLPLFVKPCSEGSSKGVDERAIVRTYRALEERVAYLLDAYRQPVLIESFLPGPEVTVALLGSGSGARVLGMVEVAEDLSGYAEKKAWQADTFTPVPEGTPAEQLSSLALHAYRAVRCRDLGRIDIRFDHHGKPQLLEINPLPGLRPERSAVPVIASRQGLGYDGLIAAILESALTRCEGIAGDPKCKGAD